jgi:hypothetical protein
MATQTMNIYSCAAATSNTGFSSCNYSPGLIEGAILIPRGKEYTPTEVAAMLTTLQADLIDDVKLDRIQVIKTFIGMEDKSSEGVYETTGYGGNRKIRNGKYQWQFEYSKGALCLHKKLSTLDNKQELYDVIFVDTAENCLLGVKKGDNFGGFNIELIDVPNFKINTGTTDSKYYIQFQLQDPRQMNLYAATVVFDASVNLLDELTSLQDTSIEVVTAMSSGGIVIRLKDSCGGANVGEVYADELQFTNLWDLTRDSTGNTITTSSVGIYNPVANTLQLDFNTGDPDFSAGQTATLTFGTVAQMIANGIEGYAESSIQVTLG